MSLLVRLPSGRTRVLEATDDVYERLETLEALPAHAIHLVGRVGPGLVLEARLRVLGGGGDQPDWTELGKVSTGSKRRGPDARAPDWHADPAKYAAKMERDKRERGELVVAVGPFCVPCGKRFAKQTVYDAHLSGKKHLAALERMGRDEEAMVCRLDMEAKRRKLDAVEEARRAIGGREAVSTETEEEAAARIAAREEKLRQRAMMPMPSTVIATTVYDDGDPSSTADDGTKLAEGSSAAVPLVAQTEEPSAADLARAASGAQMSYTGGMQDGTHHVNRHTTPGLAAAHRAMAVPAAGSRVPS
jgi:hypothetical protein